MWLCCALANTLGRATARVISDGIHLPVLVIRRRMLLSMSAAVGDTQPQKARKPGRKIPKPSSERHVRSCRAAGMAMIGDNDRVN